MTEVTIPERELNSFDLPRVCILTGNREGVTFRPVKFAWYPRWVVILIVVNLLVAAIVAFALTKRVRGELPFTEQAWLTWRRGRVLFPSSIVFAVGLLFGGLFLLAADHAVLGIVALVLAIAVPVAVWAAFLRGRNLMVSKIADGSIVLRTPSAVAAREIEAHLHGGAAERAVLATTVVPPAG